MSAECCESFAAMDVREKTIADSRSVEHGVLEHG